MLDQITTTALAAIDVDAAAFRKALVTLGHVIEKRNSIPVLATARATVNSGGIAMAATDMDCELTVSIPVDTADSMTFLLPPKAMADALNKVKGRASVLSDGAALAMEFAGGSLHTANPDTPDNFPSMKPRLWRSRAQVPAHDLALALQATAHCMSTEATRYYLNGVYLHGFKPIGAATAHLRMVSTDGHRLAIYDLPMPWDAPGAILPVKQALLLQRLLKDAGTAEIAIAYPADGSAALMFSGPGWTLQTKIVDGSFPDYTRVLPQPSDAWQIMLAASDVPKVTDRAHTAMAFNTGDGKARWSDGDGMEMQRAIASEGDVTVGFNRKYLAAFIAAAPDGMIILTGHNSGDPARVTTADARFLGVLMPMRA